MNGGDDASILYHEYTHGLSNRLITDADGAGALNSPQAGAMGEGWSDWYAKDFLVSQFPELDTDATNEVHFGVYTDATPNTIRKQGLDCPVGAIGACSGFTYGDFGKIWSGPEVHYDGEIWAETLWDLRTAIGSPEALRLVTQAMRLSPPEPSFLDMRNAILLADEGSDGASAGRWRNAIWAVFAKRGMGYYASTTGSDDTAPLEDFSLPPGPDEPRGTIAGRVTDAATALPLPAATASLGALTAATGADGRYTLANVPAHSYARLVIDAPGYDRLSTDQFTVGANATTTLDATLRRNWAAVSGGASVTGSSEYAAQGCGPRAAIDQSAGTTWSNDFAAGGKSMTVTLPAAIDVDHFEIDPAEGCGDRSDAAAKEVKIETSATGTDWTLAATGMFAFGDRHRMNVVAPVAGTTGIRYVRVTILKTLTNDSSFMDMSEFAVYAKGVTPTPTPTPTPTASPEPTATATATAQPALPAATATPAPMATATPSVRPVFQLAASGKRSVRVKVHCPKACLVSAGLTVDARTAGRLRLGSSRSAGSLRRSLKAGSSTLTVTLGARARRGVAKVKSFQATLVVRSGSVVERRRVTISR
jgi:hypothetical protein